MWVGCLHSCPFVCWVSCLFLIDWQEVFAHRAAATHQSASPLRAFVGQKSAILTWICKFILFYFIFLLQLKHSCLHSPAPWSVNVLSSGLCFGCLKSLPHPRWAFSYNFVCEIMVQHPCSECMPCTSLFCRCAHLVWVTWGTNWAAFSHSLSPGTTCIREGPSVPRKPGGTSL